LDFLLPLLLIFSVICEFNFCLNCGFFDNNLDLFNFSFFIFNINGIFKLTTSDIFFQFYLVFLFIYFIGLFGVLLNLKNILISLLFIEISYFGIVGFLLFISIFFDMAIGFAYSLLILLVAAGESVVGLGIVIVVFRYQRSITFEGLNVLQS
jgi:NADH:ubiquinone oxidoreductase subunit K